jgi:hypothetical protein
VAGEAVDEVVLAPVGLVGDDDDVAAVESTGCLSPFSSGRNFWIVVNTTPPDARDSRARRSARSAACSGGCRSSSLHRENTPNNWSSRSLRSVSTTIVGFSIAGWRMTRPA